MIKNFEQNMRTISLVTEKKFEKLQNSNVLVVGVGGVGGYALEMLARAGVGHITLCDFDLVDISNLNRQICALHSTIGKKKVDVFRERLLDINPNIIIDLKCCRFCEENLPKVFDKRYDYVLDCIDDIDNKVLLIKHCKQNSIEIVSAMGAGNKFDIPTFVVSDIFVTHDDALAKKLRKCLREVCVESLDVIYSFAKGQKSSSDCVGSISYYPAMCGCVMASHVIRKLMEAK